MWAWITSSRNYIVLPLMDVILIRIVVTVTTVLFLQLFVRNNRYIKLHSASLVFQMYFLKYVSTNVT